MLLLSLYNYWVSYSGESFCSHLRYFYMQVGGWTQVYGNHLTYATVRGASHGTPVTQGHMAPCLKLVPLPSTRVVPFHPTSV